MVDFKEVVQSRSGEVEVEFHGHMQAWEFIEPVLKRFAQKWKIFISVSNPHGRSTFPIDKKDTLFIRFWSNSATGGQEYNDLFLKSAYGVPLRKGRNGDKMLPSGEGETITCEPEGEVVAEVVEGTLFVLFDLPHVEEPDTGVLMERILTDFEYSKSFLKITPLRTRAIWNKFFRKVPSKKNLKKEYWNNFQNLFLNGDVFETSERIIRQRFEELKNVVEDHHGSLRVINDRIIVSLGPIQWKGGDEPRDIGCYDFVMYPKSEQVYFHQTTSGIEGHHTVYADGSACLGNVDGSMRRFIQRKEFDFAVALAYEFLTTG